MTEQEFQKLVLEKLICLDTNISNLDSKVTSLDSKVTNLDSRVLNLEKKQDSFEKILLDFRDEFIEYKWTTEKEFETTRKLIGQAFDKINDNITYQEKISQIERILQNSRKREFA